MPDMAVRIVKAVHNDIPALLACAQALVASDAGVYDAAATNTDWAITAGRSYCETILNNDDNIALLAKDDKVRGHLVGRLSGPGSVHPIRVAELESIYVYPEHRGRGTGQQLVEEFLAWAAGKGADRASVTAYAANEGAQRLYRRYGFEPKSVVLHRDL